MKIAIIGNGIAGVTAARWIRKLSDTAEITIISDESDYFFSRTALMYIYMGHMRLCDTQPFENDFWQKNRINLLRGRVETIDFEKYVLKIQGKTDFEYDRLIIATGSKSNKFGWEGGRFRSSSTSPKLGSSSYRCSMAGRPEGLTWKRSGPFSIMRS